jgi:hypothetical protein
VIVVTRRIALAQFCVLFYCIIVLFLIFCPCLYVCAYVDHAWTLRSWVDIEPPEEYQEPPSSYAFEQQPGEFEEDKYNMNILSLLNTISYCILILYAYKDFLATFILYINTLGYILVSWASCCALTFFYWSFLIWLMIYATWFWEWPSVLCAWAAHISLKYVFYRNLV